MKEDMVDIIVEKLLNEAEHISDYKQKFIDFCKDKVKDLGKLTTVSEDDPTEQETYEILYTSKSYKQAQPLAYILNNEDEYLMVANEEGEVFINSPMCSPEEDILELDFDEISTNYYEYILDYWDDLDMDARIEDYQADKENVEKADTELVVPEPFKYYTNGGSVEVYCDKYPDLKAKTTTMKGTEYVQEHFDINGLWEVNIIDENGKWKERGYADGWQEAMNMLKQQYDACTAPTPKSTVTTPKGTFTTEEYNAKEDEVKEAYKKVLQNEMSEEEYNAIVEDALKMLHKNDIESAEFWAKHDLGLVKTVSEMEAEQKSKKSEAKSDVDKAIEDELKLADKVEKYLADNYFYPADVFAAGTRVMVEIKDGHWKHAHRFCDVVMDEIGYTLVEEEVTAEDGSDCYSAIRHYELKDTKLEEDTELTQGTTIRALQDELGANDLDTEYREAYAKALVKFKLVPNKYPVDISAYENKRLYNKQIQDITNYMLEIMSGDFQFGTFKRHADAVLKIYADISNVPEEQPKEVKPKLSVMNIKELNELINNASNETNYNMYIASNGSMSGNQFYIEAKENKFKVRANVRVKSENLNEDTFGLGLFANSYNYLNEVTEKYSRGTYSIADAYKYFIINKEDIEALVKDYAKTIDEVKFADVKTEAKVEEEMKTENDNNEISELRAKVEDYITDDYHREEDFTDIEVSGETSPYMLELVRAKLDALSDEDIRTMAKEIDARDIDLMNWGNEVHSATKDILARMKQELSEVEDNEDYDDLDESKSHNTSSDEFEMNCKAWREQLNDTAEFIKEFGDDDALMTLEELGNTVSKELANIGFRMGFATYTFTKTTDIKQAKDDMYNLVVHNIDNSELDGVTVDDILNEIGAVNMKNESLSSYDYIRQQAMMNASNVKSVVNFLNDLGISDDGEDFQINEEVIIDFLSRKGLTVAKTENGYDIRDVGGKIGSMSYSTEIGKWLADNKVTESFDNCICPQCMEEITKLIPVETRDLAPEELDQLDGNEEDIIFFECPECGYRDKKEMFCESKLTEAEEVSGTIKEQLNTGLLPIVDVDMYSLSDALYNIDVTQEELDDLVQELAPIYVKDAIQKVLPSAEVYVTGVYHPKQYNFSGDELEFDLVVSAKEYNALKDKVENEEAFISFLKDNYSSQSGFVSFLANNIDDYRTQDNWKQMVQVIMYALKQAGVKMPDEGYTVEFLDEVAARFPEVDREAEDLEESKSYTDKEIEDAVKADLKANGGVYTDDSAYDVVERLTGIKEVDKAPEELVAKIREVQKKLTEAVEEKEMTIEEIKARIAEINKQLAYIRRRDRVCLAFGSEQEQYELNQEREQLRAKLKQAKKTEATQDYSDPIKVNGKWFRYNYKYSEVEYITHASNEFGPIEVVTSVGLNKDTWNDKQARNEYLQGWAEELEAEANSLADDFIKNELPYLTESYDYSKHTTKEVIDRLLQIDPDKLFNIDMEELEIMVTDTETGDTGVAVPMMSGEGLYVYEGNPSGEDDKEYSIEEFDKTHKITGIKAWDVKAGEQVDINIFDDEFINGTKWSEETEEPNVNIIDQINDMEYRGIWVRYVAETNTVQFIVDQEKADKLQLEDTVVDTIQFRNQTPKEIKHHIDTELDKSLLTD
jgi:hypothetical protein